MWKKIFITGLAVVMALSLIACGSGSSGAGEGEAGKAPETGKNPSAGNGVVIKIGYENTESEPIGQAVKHWKELVDEKGDGSLRLELFPNSTLGTKSQLIDMMLLGEPVVTIADGAFYADYGVKDMGIMYGPFFFDSWDDVWKLVESDWYKEQSKQLEEKGLKLLASNWIYGERYQEFYHMGMQQ